MSYSSDSTDVVIIQCFSNNVNEWVNLRSQYYSQSLNSLFKLFGVNRCLVETVDLDETCTRCTTNVLCEIFTDDEKNQCLFEENGEKVIDVSHLKHKIKPALTFNKIYVTKDLSVLCKASSLRNLIYGRRNIFVVPHSLLVKCQKLIALLLLLWNEDVHVCIFAIGNVRCASGVTEFKDSLRSTLQEQCANTIEVDKENLLLDTCLKYNLLSVSNKSEVTVDQNSYKEPIFYQYNNARLSAILTKHANSYPPLASFEEIDWNCVFGDSEWKLLFNHLFVSQSVLTETVNNISLPMHKVAQHLSAMIREFSLYYSKTKVLIAPQPQSLPLISSRIYFVKAIYKTLNRYFQCLSIIGVTKM
ncbi:DALR anticodon-binding domain-containing protein 3-like protein [Leptotrombidium deliense]|uniref:DALR anticodon-binding domain-containing protein 3-like protein n=1 Tax=Leptotrombidium deliense TaxID=299467 RepID=A0A443SPM1_9ACAR|nr:DALR anticodon-binding domain-containing protein 3-like protein [Leptotrombidium deliense]